MIISEQWLREWVSPDLTTEELAHQITMAGLEVDAIDPVAGEFSGVVVAEILKADQHPDADKLRVCVVSTGEETFQIVCGAPNARPGLKAPLATVGGVLPGDFRIKKAKLRGVESFGMLCAEKELGLSEANEGLMELAADAPVGTDLRDYLGLDDQVIEIGLTPNRADCLGIGGIAREVGLLNNLPVNAPVIEPVVPAIDDTFPVKLEAPQRCPRFVGRVIRDIDIRSPSPLWLQEKLRRVGLRSIDPVVDVTNYVMMELGQPMHAYDLATLSGGIRVRTAEAAEKLTLLDGQELEMDAETLVIADHEKPLGLAGIMGGEGSGVSETTSDLFLEVAFFTPDMLAGKARSYGLHTDASHRFERGVDWQGQVAAMERATALLLEIVGGKAGPLQETVAEDQLPAKRVVNLRQARIPRLLGFDMAAAEVERILAGLGLEVERSDEGWRCGVPSWRFDISIEADLLEELARVYGYNQLPVTPISATLHMPAHKEGTLELPRLRAHLAARGYREAITYSFVEPRVQQLIDPDLTPVALENPISADMSVMRTSLLPGLLSALVRNTKRQQGRVRLFESGQRFLPSEDGLAQEPTLAMAVCGSRFSESWNQGGEGVDFFDLKGDLESVLELGSAAEQFRFESAERAGLHPGQTAAIYRGDELVGHIGALHPAVAKALDVGSATFVCEIRLAAVLEAAIPAFAEVSKYPEVRRDLAVLVDREIQAGDLLANVRASAGTYLKDLTLFDVYEGKGIDPKRKSLAIGLTFQDLSRTLSEEDVNLAVDQVVDSLEKNYKAELRS